MAIDVVPTVLYSGMIGVVVSALLRTTNIPKHKQISFLLGLLVLLLIHILGQLYIYSGAYQYIPEIAGFQLPMTVLLGPALYFYAYEAMFPADKLSLKDYLIAMLGPLVITLGMIPFIFGISPEQMLALVDPATRDPDLWKIAVFTCLFTTITFILFTFAYLIAALKMHAQHRKQLMDQYSEIEQRSMDWFRIILILWGLVWFIYATNYALSFLGSSWSVTRSILPLFELIVLVLFTHFALKQSEYNEPKEIHVQKTPIREAVISDGRMQEIAAKLSATMEEQELFKDEDLSLNNLSAAVSVSENHISETLSQFMKVNFFQFVNSYRVEEAKKLLTDTDMLVASITYEVGFKSKSTFYSAFKNIVGTTPTAYKKSQQP